MENFNINDLLAKLEEADSVETLSVENRAAELIEIENTIKAISKLLHNLFERKAELGAEEEKYQAEQEILNQRYQDLNDLFAPKK